MIDVGTVEDVSRDSVRVVTGRDGPIAVFYCDGSFYALPDTCSHAEASLAEGFLDGFEVECPLHGSCFDIRTGEPLCLPADAPVRTYRVIVDEGRVIVDDAVT